MANTHQNRTKRQRRVKSGKRVKQEQKRIARNMKILEAYVTIPYVLGVGEYHDFIAMNLHEIVLDPTPEDCDRILRESACELVVDNVDEL